MWVTHGPLSPVRTRCLGIHGSHLGEEKKRDRGQRVPQPANTTLCWKQLPTPHGGLSKASSTQPWDTYGPTGGRATLTSLTFIKNVATFTMSELNSNETMNQKPLTKPTLPRGKRCTVHFRPLSDPYNWTKLAFTWPRSSLPSSFTALLSLNILQYLPSDLWREHIWYVNDNIILIYPRRL